MPNDQGFCGLAEEIVVSQSMLPAQQSQPEKAPRNRMPFVPASMLARLQKLAVVTMPKSTDFEDIK